MSKRARQWNIRVVALLLAAAIALGLSACTRGGSDKVEPTTTATTTGTTTTATTTETTATTTEKIITNKPTRTTATPIVDVKKKKLSVLIIGNSHSIDAFWLLYQAYMDQYSDTDLCVGIYHYNGGSIDEHLAFLKDNTAAIRYYKNTSGWWNIKYDVTPESVLTDQPWDVIMMQPAKEDLADPNLNHDGRYALAEAVDRYVKNPHEFVWHVSWPSPNDEMFFSPDYVRQPPVGYKDKLTRLYGFNPVNQFSVMTGATKKWVLTDPLYSRAVCSGTSIMQAHLTQGIPQAELWRDYTHLSDYGRLMAAYALVAQLTGKPIKSVGIDAIPVKWRHKQNKAQGVQTITPAMKKVMIKAVNHSLSDPWSIPPQTGVTTTTTTATVTTTATTTTQTTDTTTTTTDTTTETVSTEDTTVTTEDTTTVPTEPTE
ncbi:MAG: DUF4886 domain-containing protein [Clostridia bacterium]|nr:DUF4886 domain-containing protein [Clostridia bacterium]